MVGLLWNTLLNGREISRRPLIDLSDQWLGISLLFDLHLQTYAYRPSGVLPNVYTVYCGTEFAAASTLHIMCRLRKWLMFSHTQIQTVQSIVGSLHKIHCTFILAKWIVFLKCMYISNEDFQSLNLLPLYFILWYIYMCSTFIT